MITNHILGFKTFQTAEKTIIGIEAFSYAKEATG
jgi:hypothetical protein